MAGTCPAVTLCGSTRFKDALVEAQKRLARAGDTRVFWGLFGHAGDEEA